MQDQEKNNLVSTFFIGDTRWGINIMQTQEIIKIPDITLVHNAQDYIKGIINLRGRIVTILSLCKKLDIPSKGENQENRIIIVNDSDEYIGLLVDKVSDVIDVEGTELTPAPTTVSGTNGDNLEGIYHHGDLTIALLNLKKILSQEEEDS